MGKVNEIYIKAIREIEYILSDYENTGVLDGETAFAEITDAVERARIMAANEYVKQCKMYQSEEDK